MTLLTLFTLFHVALSLVGIVTGFVVVAGWLRGQAVPHWSRTFLATTAATTLTGFMFPIHGFTPALGTGVVSTLVLAPVLWAFHRRRLAGGWRRTYVLGALAALYLNTFVLVVQLFLKVPALHALAPTQKEPPFAIAQGLVLLLFVVLGVAALRRFPSPALQPA